MNQLFDNARERLLGATLNWPTLSLCMLAYDLTYTFDPTDLIQSDIGTPVAVSQTFTGQSVVAGGYARSDAAIFTTVPAGPAVKFLILAETNATPASRKLLAFFDQAQGLPFTPNGGLKKVKPDWTAAQGWFRA